MTTVLLVHGAFADGSSWSKVIAHLHEEGLPARALANPLRGLTTDGEYVASVLAQTEGPVLLVGHSYGGPVVTYAGSSAPNVQGIVYVASFGLDQGMSARDSTAGYPSDSGSAHVAWSYPEGEGPELTLDESQYHAVFAADLDAGEAAMGAASQRPAAAAAFAEPLAVPPAWKRLPSWWVLPGADRTINPDSQRAAAERIGATLVELQGGSHSIALTRSREVADVIIGAAHELAGGESLHRAG